jgi:hypothetical protein
MFKYAWERSPIEAGRTEYGLPRIRFLHFVIATGSDGSRFAHFHGEMTDDPECPPTTARLLRKALDTSPDPRTSSFWEVTNSVEGSPAHERDLIAESFDPLEADPTGLFGFPSVTEIN